MCPIQTLSLFYGVCDRMETVVVSTLDPDQAYQMMQELKKDAEKIAEAVEQHFKYIGAYSPFKYVGSKIGGELRDIRKSLIDLYVGIYQRAYTPNYEPTVNFTELMDQAEGREGFNSLVIKQWFETKAADRKQIKADSLAQMMDKAKYFLPWSGYSDILTVKDLVKGEMLELDAHSWRKGDRWSKGYLSLNSNGVYEALQRLIDVATRRADPSINGWSRWLTDHIDIRDPQEFYGKHQVKHKTVEAFQFFKNGKFKIWFKQARHAKAVARRLLKARAIARSR